MSIGTWHNIPDGFRGWAFVRCGMKGSPRAEAQAAHMRRMGYSDAPPGVRCAGFETDGAGGLYLCIPSQARRILRERTAQAKRQITSQAAFQTHLASISNTTGVNVTGSVSETKQIVVDPG